MSTDQLYDDPVLGETVIRSIEKWKSQSRDGDRFDSTLVEHRHGTFLKISFILACIVITFASMGIAITYGAADIGFLEVYRIIWERITDNVQDVIKDRIVVDLRMPRIVGGVFAGAALSICGVVLQNVMRNPLADPYTTGVSSGASLGAVLSMTVGVHLVSAQWDLVITAFIFSLIPTVIMVTISKLKNSSPITMVMSGLAVMYVFNAITTVLMLLSDPNNLARIYRWQVGSLNSITWDNIPIMVFITAIGLVVMQVLAKHLNVLATGDESAKGMGLDVEKIRIIMLILVGIVVAATVSFTGLIGFVGLVVPHIARIFVGSDNRFLIPASAALGSAVLVIADVIGRWVIAPTILQVGVIMSFIGGPVFLWLILRRNNSLWS